MERNLGMVLVMMDSIKWTWPDYKAMAEESAVLLNPKTILTPHLCRKGCKHYDSVGDQKSAEFREFCWTEKDSSITRDTACKHYENINPNLPEDVLTF